MQYKSQKIQKSERTPEIPTLGESESHSIS